MIRKQGLFLGDSQVALDGHLEVSWQLFYSFREPVYIAISERSQPVDGSSHEYIAVRNWLNSTLNILFTIFTNTATVEHYWPYI